MSERRDYLEAIAGELSELGPDVIDMLAGREAEDTVVLRSLIQSAALALHAGMRDELPKAAVEIARGVVASARRAPGKAILERVFDALDLATLATFEGDPDDEPEELQSRLHALFELGLLVDVLTGERRERLCELLEQAAADVLARDDLYALYETAFLLGRMAELPVDHPVAELLATIEVATDEIADLEPAPGAAEVELIVAEAHAKYEAALTPIERLVRWGRAAWGEGATWLTTPHRLRVLAASAQAGPRWPAARVRLAARDGVEVGLRVSGDDVLLEVVGRSLPNGVEVLVDGEALEHVAARFPEQRLRRLVVPASGALPRVTVRLEDVGWEIDLADVSAERAPPASTGGAHPWRDPRRLAAVHARAPGAVRAELLRLARVVAAGSLALAMDFASQAARVEIPRLGTELGAGMFVVVSEGMDAPGFLMRVAAAGLAGGVPAGALGIGDAALEAVAAWVARLVGARGLDEAIDLRFAVAGDTAQALALDGDSWQLAAALAVISERLGQAQRIPIVASGRLGTGIGEVLPVGLVAAKRAVIALEAGDVTGASALVVDAQRDVRATLADLFGADWQPRLAVALGVASQAHARAAMQAWRRWFGRRNTLEAAADCERALTSAEQALAAGVTGVHRSEALWVAGACRLHRGESALAAGLFADVEAALATARVGDVPALVREELCAYRGIALVDHGRPSEAVALLDGVLERLDRVAQERPEAADRRFHEVRLQVAGTLQRAVAFTGDLARARALLAASLEVGTPSERARSLGDLAEVARRAGDLEAARTALVEAQEALDDVATAGMRALTERFLAVYSARSGVDPRLMAIASAPPDWKAWPQPLEVLEALVAGPEAELVAWVEDNVLAQASAVSTIHLLVVLGAVARAAAEGLSAALLAVVQGLVPVIEGRAEVEAEVRAKVVATAAGEAGALAGWARCCPY